MKRFIITAMIVAGAAMGWRCTKQGGRPDSLEKTSESTQNLPLRESTDPYYVSPADARALPDLPVAVNLVRKIYGHPIEFWGRVVDEDGNPVESAEVELSATSTFAGDPSYYSAKSDANGRFSLGGVKGATLYINVRKSGYYRVPEKSYATISYGYASNSETNRPPPTAESPTEFVLQRIKLVSGSHRSRGWQVPIPQDGTPMSIYLSDGRHAIGHKAGDIVIETFIDLNKRIKYRYPWRCKISVPGGGLRVRDSVMNFDAPEDGYATDEEIEMPFSTETAEQWNGRAARDYFLKLPDGRFGRICLDIHTDDRPEKNRVYFEAIVDPNGGRHLEIGPDQIGNPK